MPTRLLLLTTVLVFIGASCSRAADGGVFKSEDQGETWQQKVFVGREKKKVVAINNVNVEKIEFDPLNPNIIYLATKSGVYKTETSGEQWYQLPIPANRVRDMDVNTLDTNVIYLTLENNILQSKDAGVSWEIIYTDAQGATIQQIETDWFNNDRLFATTSIGTVLFSADAGVNWMVILQRQEPLTKLIMDELDSRTIYILELEKNVLKTMDGGVTWNEVFNEESITKLTGGERLFDLYMDPNNSATLYGLSKQGIIRSYDAAASWDYVLTLIEKGAGQNSQIRGLTVMPGNPQIILFAVNNLLHKSMDHGLSWKTIENFPSSRRITTLIAPLGTDQIIYAGTEEMPKEKKGFFIKR